MCAYALCVGVLGVRMSLLCGSESCVCMCLTCIMPACILMIGHELGEATEFNTLRIADAQLSCIAQHAFAVSVHAWH